MSTDPQLAWCPGCGDFIEQSTVSPTGNHNVCDVTAIVGSPRQVFREMSLDAIPRNLISSPAVGAGDARRYKIAAALWPSVERLLREIERERGQVGSEPS